MQLIEQVGCRCRMTGVFVMAIDITKMLCPSARSTIVTARHYPPFCGVLTIVIVDIVIIVATIVPAITLAIVSIMIIVVAIRFRPDLTMLRYCRRAAVGAAVVA